jgi:hypothetical protein
LSAYFMRSSRFSLYCKHKGVRKHTHTHTQARNVCCSGLTSAFVLFTCYMKGWQNRIYTMYMTVYLVISLPEILYIHRIYMYRYMGLANPYICTI